MTFAERSESAMTELVDKIANVLTEGRWDSLPAFNKYVLKDQILPVLAACIDVLDTEPHRAKRGDEIEAWIKRERDRYTAFQAGCPEWQALDALLDDYRLHADTGTPLTSDVDEMGG